MRLHRELHIAQVSKGSGDKSFKISVSGRKPREFEVCLLCCGPPAISFFADAVADAVAVQLLTKPTDFEQSESLKLLLQGIVTSASGSALHLLNICPGAFSKTHSVDSQRW